MSTTKIGTLISNSTYFTNSPQGLLIVIANANCIGIYRLLEWNGISIEEGAKEILGINACLLACRPKNNQASKTQFVKRMRTILDSLQSPCFGARLAK